MTIDEFFDGCLARGLSMKTAVVYATALRPMLDAYDSIDELSATEIMKYSERVRSSNSMRSSLRSALKNYYEMIGRADSPYRAVPVPRRARMVCRALDESEAARLVHEARRRGDREGLAVLLGLFCGLRRAEIASLCWGDVSEGWITVTGKGATRTIPMHPIALDAWNAIEGPKRARDRVFEGRWGEKCNPTTVWTWVDDISRAALGRHVTTHVLRHTALATALDNTRDLRAVQHFAGHAKPETTAGYTRVRRDRLIEVSTSIKYEEAS